MFCKLLGSRVSTLSMDPWPGWDCSQRNGAKWSTNGVGGAGAGKPLKPQRHVRPQSTTLRFAAEMNAAIEAIDKSNIEVDAGRGPEGRNGPSSVLAPRGLGIHQQITSKKHKVIHQPCMCSVQHLKLLLFFATQSCRHSGRMFHEVGVCPDCRVE
jgi:hypothetical protein